MNVSVIFSFSSSLAAPQQNFKFGDGQFLSKCSSGVRVNFSQSLDWNISNIGWISRTFTFPTGWILLTTSVIRWNIRLLVPTFMVPDDESKWLGRPPDFASGVTMGMWFRLKCLNNCWMLSLKLRSWPLKQQFDKKILNRRLSLLLVFESRWLCVEGHGGPCLCSKTVPGVSCECPPRPLTPSQLWIELKEVY